MFTGGKDDDEVQKKKQVDTQPYVSTIPKNIVSMLNPRYTQAPAYNSLGPMNMYQQFKQTGQYDPFSVYPAFQAPAPTTPTTPPAVTPTQPAGLWGDWNNNGRLGKKETKWASANPYGATSYDPFKGQSYNGTAFPWEGGPVATNNKSSGGK